jgi:hypothetical protein
MRPRGHQVAVLWSRGSRDAYAAEAAARGETYTFTDARGHPRTWLKGEWAYLAPNAASLLLARCNLKHDVVEESQLTDESLAGYRALLIPDAGHLAAGTAERIERWLRGGDRRLIVAGKTNLPVRLLGLGASAPAPVTGYTGWQWLPGSPFAGADWEPRYVTGYAGHGASRVTPLPGSRVLADLVELTGDLTTADTATVTRLGPAVVLTERTAYIANPVFELLGGMLQAHLNVEAVRHWANPTHWGDTIVFFLRRILLEAGLEPLWQTRLRSFGTYDGVLSFRHDVHGALDFDFLDYQIQNLIAASYDIEDPAHSTNISEAQAAEWVARTTRHSFIEPALHNDSSIGDPPVAIRGAGLYEHVRDAAANLGFPVYTGGRHAGGHMHPETLDAMDYLYAMDERILGLCTFCYYHMIEYGVRHPDVMAGGAIGGKPLTYVTDVRRTIATPGIWFPFHPVVTTDAEWRPAPRLGPHARVRCRLRAGGDHLRRPQRAAARGGRPSGERGLQLPVSPRARARSVHQRRQGHPGLPALLHQPGGARQSLDREPARALPAHGGLRGAAAARGRHRHGGDRDQSDPPAASPA